jgi:hypothetical protein
MPDSRRARRGDLPAKIVLLVLGLVLLAAAGMKAVQLSTHPVGYKGVLTNRHFLMFEVVIELFMGFGLLSGVLRRLAWCGAGLCFTFFIGITIYEGVVGMTSCGCFGHVPIHPWAMLVFDVAALGALLIFRPDLKRPAQVPMFRARLIGALAAAAAGSAASLVFMLRYEPATLTADGRILGDDPTVRLMPERWVKGKPLPLLGHVDVGKRLATGEWTVLLYHHNCPYCRRKIRRLHEQATHLAGRRREARIAVISVPPHAPADRNPVPAQTPLLAGKLPESRGWFVETPTLVRIRDGRVLDVKGPDKTRHVDVRDVDLASLPVARDEHDFKYVDPGSRHFVLFELANPLDRDLAIRGYTSECPCLKVPTKAPGSIPAGGSARVLIAFLPPKNPQPGERDYSGRVLFRTDATGKPMLPVRVRGRIGLHLVLDPDKADVGSLTPGQTRTTTLALRNDGRKPVRVSYCGSTRRGVTGQVVAGPLRPGERRDVRVEVTAGPDDAGKQNALLQVHTDDPHQPQVNAKITYTVAPR